MLRQLYQIIDKLATRHCLAVVFLVPQFAWASTVPLRLIHTNDLHSHYRTDRGPQKLGGIARVATTIRMLRERAPNQNSLVLDGGDWSEGQIYYALGGGRTALEMMEAIGYDAAVLGNHDWLNGPSQLLQLLNSSTIRTKILASNLDTSRFAQGQALKNKLPSFAKFDLNGIRVGIIGLLTYELIYDGYFGPVRITEPFAGTRRLAQELKRDCDVVVVISHNSLPTNRIIAGLPGVDVVIHAHDHMKIARPLVVERNGKRSFIVETQHWGFFVGSLDLVVNKTTKTVELANYQLVQQDARIPEDPNILAQVANYEHQITQEFGNIFQDHLATSTIHVDRSSTENIYGNLLADAYRNFTNADVAIEHTNLTSGDLPIGPLHSVDFFNALAAIFDPNTRRAWTLKVYEMTGQTLQWMMNLILGIGSFNNRILVSVSGMTVYFDPAISYAIDNPIALPQGQSSVHAITVGGRPIDANRRYRVAVSGGVDYALQFVEQNWGNRVTRTLVNDTQTEAWRVLANYVHRIGVLRSSHISRGNRLVPIRPDFALYSDEFSVVRQGNTLHIEGTIYNLGNSPTEAQTLLIDYDRTPNYFVDDPNPTGRPIARVDVPAIARNGSIRVRWQMAMPANMTMMIDAYHSLPIYIYTNIRGVDQNSSNNGVMLWVSL